MKPLEYPERHYLNAAVGWLELGNAIEAKAEVDRIFWANRLHPEVFLVRWHIHAQLENWEAARDLARMFTKVLPDRPSGWLCLSFSFYKLKRPLEAFLHLVNRVEAFPKVTAIPYFLACYSWELGDPEATGKWLAKFKALGGNLKIKPTLWDETAILLDADQVQVVSSSSKPSNRQGPIALA